MFGINNEQLIRITSSGGIYHKVDWVKPVSGGSSYKSVRIPEEKVTDYNVGDTFIMASKKYHSLEELAKETVDAKKGIYKDIYGRTVVAAKEKFPCFDSYDYAYEKRYFHWLFIRDKNKLYCYYYADERNEAKVIEDVASIEHGAYKDLKWMGYCDDTSESILKI